MSRRLLESVENTWLGPSSSPQDSANSYNTPARRKFTRLSLPRLPRAPSWFVSNFIQVILRGWLPSDLKHTRTKNTHLHFHDTQPLRIKLCACPTSAPKGLPKVPRALNVARSRYVVPDAPPSIHPAEPCSSSLAAIEAQLTLVPPHNSPSSRDCAPAAAIRSSSHSAWWIVFSHV